MTSSVVGNSSSAACNSSSGGVFEGTTEKTKYWKAHFTAWEGLGCSMQNRISDLPQQRVCGSLLPLRSRLMDIAVSVGLIVGQLKLLGVVESMQTSIPSIWMYFLAV